MRSINLKKHFRMLVGAPVLAVLIFAACFSGFLAPADPFEIDTKNILKGPSRQHPFGTDQIGRDILSRVIYGARVSITIGLVVTFFATLIALIGGSAAGYYGGWTDTIIARLSAFSSGLLKYLDWPVVRFSTHSAK